MVYIVRYIYLPVYSVYLDILNDQNVNKTSQQHLECWNDNDKQSVENPWTKYLRWIVYKLMEATTSNGSSVQLPTCARIQGL